MTLDEAKEHVRNMHDEQHTEPGAVALGMLLDRLDVYEAAPRHVQSHEGVSVANARRQQRVAAGALRGQRPEDVLAPKGGADG